MKTQGKLMDMLTGYAAQFIGHAVEQSMPVLVKYPVQANLAAPFFTVVELFKIVGLRDGLFDAVQAEISNRREGDAGKSATRELRDQSVPLSNTLSQFNIIMKLLAILIEYEQDN